MEAPNEAQACPCCGSDGPIQFGSESELCAHCIAAYGIDTEEEEEEADIYSPCKDSIPDVSMLPVGEGGGSITTTRQGPGCGGVHSGSGGTSIGRPPPSRVSEDERPHKRQCTGIPRLDGSGEQEIPWELSQLSQPQIGTTILHEGKQLHIEHGSDGDGDGGLEASSSLGSGGEDSGSDEAFGDEGMLDHLDPDDVHNRAMWDTWRQTVFDVQAWADPLSLFSIDQTS